MSQKILNLDLIRDGSCTPWGFRLSGGVDIGTPLVIQRVSMGSPAEGELQKNDLILSISGQDARKMSHQRAIDLIAKAGNQLSLVVARSAFSSSGSSPTMSPTPPLSAVHQADYMKPLPKTQFPQNTKSYLPTVGLEQDEKAAITNQAYRTVPLITPTLKTSKDYPVGSYLRHSRDTSGKSGASKTTDPHMLTRVQEAVLEAALSSPRASVSSSRTSTPDIGYQNVSIRQYNSPINMYSHQAIVETLNAQVANKPPNDLPRVQSPERPLLDISKSPTYQLIQEEEHRVLSQEKMEEQKPVPTKIHDLREVPKQVFASIPHDPIQQSGSFKILMATMKSTPGV